MVIVAAGVAGNVVGSWIAYGVGRYKGREWALRWHWLHITPKRLDAADRWFARYGAWAVLISRMPADHPHLHLAAGGHRAHALLALHPAHPASAACPGCWRWPWPGARWATTGTTSSTSCTTSTTRWCSRSSPGSSTCWCAGGAGPGRPAGLRRTDRPTMPQTPGSNPSSPRFPSEGTPPYDSTSGGRTVVEAPVSGRRTIEDLLREARTRLERLTPHQARAAAGGTA